MIEDHVLVSRVNHIIRSVRSSEYEINVS